MRTSLQGHSLSGSESRGSPPPLAIPLIVERIFKDSIPWVIFSCYVPRLICSRLKKICQCLGYKLSSLKSFWAPFNDALEHYDSRKRPISTRYKPSKRQCRDHSSSPTGSASLKFKNGYQLTRPDHDGQSAQYYSSRAANISTSGSPLSEGKLNLAPPTLFVFCLHLKFSVHDDNTPRTTAQRQSPFQSPQADSTSYESNFGTAFLVGSSKVTVLDHEHTLLDENPHSTHLHSLGIESVIRQGAPLVSQSTFNMPDELEVNNFIDFHADATPIPTQDTIDILLDRYCPGVANFVDFHADATPILPQLSVEFPIGSTDILNRPETDNFIYLHADATPIPTQDQIDTPLDRHASGVGNLIDLHADATPVITQPPLQIPPSTFSKLGRPNMAFDLFDTTSGVACDIPVGLTTPCPNQTHPEGLADVSSMLSSDWNRLDDNPFPSSIIQTISVL
jgi:hypothetical protein